MTRATFSRIPYPNGPVLLDAALDEACSRRCVGAAGEVGVPRVYETNATPFSRSVFVSWLNLRHGDRE